MENKINKTRIVLAFIVFFSVSFTEPNSIGTIVWGMTSETSVEINNVNVVDETEDFLEALGHKESGNRYNVVNKYGYMGKYQFGKRTLKGLGYDVTKKEFLSSPDIQERAMNDLLRHNKEKLQHIIDEYDGDTVHGIYVTESGILAAAHLAGVSNVKKFFSKGRDFKDGNGTRLTSYLSKFGGYNLLLE